MKLFTCIRAKLLQLCPTLCNPMDPMEAHQPPLSMGFFRQEYCKWFVISSSIYEEYTSVFKKICMIKVGGGLAIRTLCPYCSPTHVETHVGR